MKKLLCAAGLLAATHSAWGQDAEGPPVTPYRPSVSSPAQLPYPGQLEMEVGGLSSKSDDGRRNSLPLTFKLGFSEQWGVVVSGEGYVSSPDGNGGRAKGVGDTLFVLKRAFVVDEATAFGLELGAKAPTAKDSIGSGRADYSLNGIYSKDMANNVHMDLNLNLTRLGADDPGAGRTQTGWSASFSAPVAERWSANWELSGTRRDSAASTAQFLLAAIYSPNKRLSLDVGFTRGLNNATPDWAFFTGAVFPLAKLW